jgi:hypothetical protein
MVSYKMRVFKTSYDKTQKRKAEKYKEIVDGLIATAVSVFL